MPRFPSARLLASAVCLAICFTIYYLQFVPHRVARTPGPQTPESTTLPSLSPEHLKIKKFWSKWSTHLHNARPLLPPLERVGTAPNTMLRPGFSKTREPSSTYLFLSKANITSLSKQHRSLLKKLQHADPPLSATARELYDGTGIVMVIGGEYTSAALTTLRMLRRTGCTLPVEAFIGSRSEYESIICDIVLPVLGASCVVLPTMLAPPLSPDVKHYQLKSLAMVFSRFQKVLYLDSDSIPLRDPTALFKEKVFEETGLIVWPDFWKATEDPVFYIIAGMEGMPKGLPASSSEAGQLLVDKKRHLEMLLLAVYYNIYGPGWYYELLSQGAMGAGDKETFLAAAVALGSKWHMVDKGVEFVGYTQVSGRFKGGGMVQFWPGTEDRPAFLHANTPKMNAGHLVDEGDLVDQGHRVRLWGPKENVIKKFGDDIEKIVWKELIATGCSLADVVEEWKGRERLCERLKEHYEAVFGEDGKV
ncbi:mannosyltransferase putative-domain-containing protein [Pyronema domesticum]|uniref:Similar to Alpha-1,2-mannosyltransferase MNN5 acc. no. P46982 n=1 Tax=Pyronema omphalodes (strain CBS 100304) TaxID=1076935 RepID=U4LW91_PYROM|nr:mannosyltransferase putative-domain-containing protein [Pyronema domesticum]CCX33386.1 Similar to Alpha-1,2-mannosyltransferase MNN5; acc. no. P46982 [Pyronema omphalodes CBS 100304]